MIKKLQKSDYLFIVALLTGLLLHILFIYNPNFYEDETFYPSIPLRLINGDSLIQHEWHLTQFSSLFLYLPVRIWLALKGSTDGITLFLRYLYLTIHTMTAAGIYTFFRKYGFWAVAAAMLFYTQTHYRLLAISYSSMYILFLLLFTLFLLLIYQKRYSFLYICAGMCFSACCVCNPLLCTIFALYIICCILWRKKEFLQRKIIDISSKQNKKKRKKTGEIVGKKSTQEFTYIETYNCFFSKKAILFFSCGISVVAVVSIIYFFSTGGTITSIVDNIGYLLNSSEYAVFVSSFGSKLKHTLSMFKLISFNMPFLLPALYAVLFFDKNRKKNTHRTIYLILSLLIAVFYVFGIIIYSPNNTTSLALTLPFMIIATVCYVLTEIKNKELFYCMWCPCVIGAIAYYFAANAFLTSIFSVLAIGNIAGVFFVRDLFEELHVDSKLKKKTYENIKNKKMIAVCHCVMLLGLCLQLFFQCYIYQYERIPEKTYKQVTTGPYAGFYMSEQYYDNYVGSINDLDIIKSRSDEKAPVLIVSYHNWMYLYIDRPFAVPTTWQEYFAPEHLKTYYKSNPDKTPKYIYVGFADYYYNEGREDAQEKADIISEMFNCSQEELSSGILLTVKE